MLTITSASTVKNVHIFERIAVVRNLKFDLQIGGQRKLWSSDSRVTSIKFFIVKPVLSVFSVDNILE